MKHDVQAVMARFAVAGTFADAQPYGSGHINDTYLVRLQEGHSHTPWILQHINRNIFRDVPGLMGNVLRVTEHLRRRLQSHPGSAPHREALTIVPTHDGAAYHQDAEGEFWRVYAFITGARTYDEVQSRDMAREAAKAFGTFQKLLMDLPAPALQETIPFFHHTPNRFAKLEAAIAADPVGRAATCRAEIDFALARQALTGLLVDQLAAGVLPQRVTHNDTKINNVMIDDRDGRGICVIDLDTVMPGTVLYDFGDEVRTTTGTAAEDERDLKKVRFQVDMFEALVQGYMEAAREFLVPAEIDQLAFCGRLITFEIGIRFLTDYLEGDVYFKTHRPGHNLDRLRTQFEMVRQMEQRAEEMERIVSRYR
jgi:Ser/Thr protein kinase RdoA (MazF antagonist)